MDQEKIGKFIKDIRLKNKLTQEEFASSLGVTYQAVSKWENGKNIPDVGIMKEISKKYGVDIDEILDGKKKKRNNMLYLILVGAVALLAIGLVVFFIMRNNKEEYKFRDVSSSCDEYKISGIAAYDANKSSLYISNVEYCGEDDLSETYDTITCTLYESYGNTLKEISSCEEKRDITLDEFLKSVSIKVENYASVCTEFDEAHLYLDIVAKGDIDYNHQIPLNITACS